MIDLINIHQIYGSKYIIQPVLMRSQKVLQKIHEYPGNRAVGMRKYKYFMIRQSKKKKKKTLLVTHAMNSFRNIQKAESPQKVET